MTWELQRKPGGDGGGGGGGSGEINTASNVNVDGIGVFKQKTALDLEFRGINAQSTKVLVTLDAGTNEIRIDVDEAELTLANMAGSIDLSGSQATGFLAAGRFPQVTGDLTNTAGSLTLTIPDDTITNAKAANMAAQTVKVNATSLTADPSDLTLATSTLLGRGPTGDIAALTIGAGLALTNSAIDRAAITGDITISQGSNTSAIGAGKVLTAMIGTNQVSNAKLGQMSANTIKANSTGGVADCQNITITGGLTMNSGAPGSLESKGSFAFPCVFSTTTTMSDPGAEGVRFNNATLASVTAFCVSASLGGRDLDTLFDALGSSQVGFIANNSSSLAYAVFNVTAVDDNGTGEFYTFTATPVLNVGVLPSNGEKLQLVYWPSGAASSFGAQDVLDMLVVRIDSETGQLIDPTGNVISGSPSVADYTALVALDAAAYDGFAVNIQSNMNNGFFASNGTGWGPLNGSYIHAHSNSIGTIGATVTANVTVTGTATASGGTKTSLTFSGAHGLTTTPAAGAYLYQTASTTGWTPNTYYQIDSITDTTHIVINVAFNASFGTPVFNKVLASDPTFSQALPLLALSSPILRANSTAILEYNIIYTADGGSKRAIFTLDDTIVSNHNQTASNLTTPYRHGFRNSGGTASNRGLVGDNSTGYAGSTNAPATLNIETNAGNTVGVKAWFGVPNVVATMGPYDYIIRS